MKRLASIALGKTLNIRFGQRGEMFQQQPVDEDVTAADFAQEDVIGAVVKEAGVVEGGVVVEGFYFVLLDHSILSLTATRIGVN